MIDADLGVFIRQRREALSPVAVGLPVGPRRRTPGLRRAELATLAGMSVDYLIRLEQGRDRNPSAQVLAALADALRLSEDDRHYLRMVSVSNNGRELCPESVPAARSVRPTIEALLDRMEPAPAFVINRMTDLLAWTAGYEALARPLGILDADPPNLLRYTFLDRRSRDVYPEWDAVATEQVGNLQAMPNEQLRTFVDELAVDAGDDFTRRWSELSLARKGTGVKRFRHPDEGELRIAFETMQLSDDDDQRLVVYLPADEVTAAALDRITGRHPGALRALSSG